MTGIDFVVGPRRPSSLNIFGVGLFFCGELA